MSTEKEVERDVDGVEVEGDDSFIIDFINVMDLGKMYVTQLGIIHVLELSLMVLLKKPKKEIKSGQNDTIDKHIKNLLFIFDVECRK